MKNENSEIKERNQGIMVLKIIGTFGVLLYHFFQQFIPALIDGNTNDYFLYHIIHSPIYAIWNAQFFIALFWVISGFLLGYRFANTNINMHLVKIVVKNWKRWLRFAFPFVFTTLFSFLLIKYNLYSNIYINSDSPFTSVFQFEPDFKAAIYEGLIGCFTNGKAKYNPVLWTMSIEFTEYFFLSILSVLIYNWKWKQNIVNGILICMILVSIIRPMYMPMIVGYVVGFNYTQCKIKSKISISLMIITAIFLAGYPFMHVRKGIYQFVPMISAWIYYSVGSVILIYCCFELNKLSKYIKIFGGGQLFEIYIFHFIIQCSITDYLYIWIMKYVKSMTLVLFMVLFLHIFCVVVISCFFQCMIFRRWNLFLRNLWEDKNSN